MPKWLNAALSGLECPRVAQSAPERTRKILEWPRLDQSVSDLLERTIVDIKYTKVSQGEPMWFRVAQCGPEWLRVPKSGPKEHQRGPKWPNVAKSCMECTKKALSFQTWPNVSLSGPEWQDVALCGPKGSKVDWSDQE